MRFTDELGRDFPQRVLMYVGENIGDLERLIDGISGLILYIADTHQDLLAQFKQVNPKFVICDFASPGVDLVQWIIDVRLDKQSPWVTVIAIDFPRSMQNEHDGFIRGTDTEGPDVIVRTSLLKSPESRLLRRILSSP